MAHLVDQDAVALEARLADLEAHPESDLRERVRLRVELFTVYEITQPAARFRTFIEETYALAERLDPPPEPYVSLACLSFLASVCVRLGQPDRGLSYGLAGLDYSDMEQPNRYTIQLFIALGALYTDLGKFDEGLNYNRQALDLAIKLHFPNLEGRIYVNLGYLYSAFEKSDLALEMFQCALRSEIYDTIPPRFKAILHNNIATEYLTLGDIDAALPHAEEAVQVRELPMVLCTFGEVLTAHQEYTWAYQVFDWVTALAEQEQDRAATCAILLARGNLYRRQGQIATAVTAFEQALAFADANKSRQAQSLQALAELYEQQGDQHRAFAALQRYLVVKEELAQEQVAQRTRATEVERQNIVARQEYGHPLPPLSSNPSTGNTDAILTIPVLPILPGILALPIIGKFDHRRASAVISSLYNETNPYPAQVVLLDITEVKVIDQVAVESIRLVAHAIKLHGRRMILVGVQSKDTALLAGLTEGETALSLYPTLQEGLMRALPIVGLDLISHKSSDVGR